MILRSYLRTVLAVEQQYRCVCYLKGCQCCSNEIVRPWAVYDVQFLVVPLNMVDCGENGVSIFLFYREIVTYCVLLRNTTAAVYYASFKQKCLRQGRLSRAIVAKQSDGLYFIGFI